MGDVLDRGKYARAIFDLLRKLETEAEAAGGQVHLLLGNHEEMNITGIALENPDYVTVEQFKSFLPDSYREKQEKKLKKKGGNGDPDLFWENLMEDPGASKEYTDFFNKNYGQWLIEHNVVEKINDIVFVHGGISPADSQKKIEDINRAYRTEFERYIRGDNFRPKMLFVSAAPLWNRSLATQNEADYQDDVDQILANLEATAIVIAHTPVLIDKNQSRFGGKIWIVDTGISSVYKGHNSALVIENGTFSIRGDQYEQNAGKKNASIGCFSGLRLGVVFWNFAAGAIRTS